MGRFVSHPNLRPLFQSFSPKFLPHATLKVENEVISKRICCTLSKKKKLPVYLSTKLNMYLKIRFHGLRKLSGELFGYVNAN